MIGPVARCVILLLVEAMTGLAYYYYLATVYIAMLSLVVPWAMLTLLNTSDGMNIFEVYFFPTH
jgi:hypothetical protein